MNKIRENIKPRIFLSITPYLIVIAFSLLTSLLIVNNLPGGDDIEYHLSRIAGLVSALENGDYKAYIHDGFNGYGYASGIFYSNFLLYFPAFIVIKTGCTVLKAYKLLIIAMMCATALSMYFCAFKISGSVKGAILASYLYTMCAYHITDVVVRAAVGEAGAFIFLPIIALGLYYVILGNARKWWVLAIGFAGLINCHVLTCAAAFIVMCVLLILNIKRFVAEKLRIISLLLAGLFAILISAAFVFPFVEGYLKNSLYVNSDLWYPGTQDASENVLAIKDIFFGIANFWKDESWPPGVGVLLIAIFFLQFTTKPGKRGKRLLRIADTCFAFGIVTLFLTTNLFPVWNIEAFDVLQYPWRLFLFASFFFCLSDGIVLGIFLKSYGRKIGIAAAIIVCIIGTVPFANVYRGYYLGDQHTTMSSDFTYSSGAGEYVPRSSSPSVAYTRGGVITSNHDDIGYVFVTYENLVVEAEYENNVYSDSYMDVPLYWYYGYAAEDENGNELKVAESDIGLVRVYLNDESGSFKVYYKGTNVQHVSLYITIISCILLILYIMRQSLWKTKTRKSA